jgi:hypothetical protein
MQGQHRALKCRAPLHAGEWGILFPCKFNEVFKMQTLEILIALPVVGFLSFIAMINFYYDYDMAKRDDDLTRRMVDHGEARATTEVEI